MSTDLTSIQIHSSPGRLLELFLVNNKRLGNIGMRNVIIYTHVCMQKIVYLHLRCHCVYAPIFLNYSQAIATHFPTLLAATVLIYVNLSFGIF